MAFNYLKNLDVGKPTNDDQNDLAPPSHIQICWTDDLSHRKTMAPLCFEIPTASQSIIHYMKFVDLSFITHSYNTVIDNFIY